MQKLSCIGLLVASGLANAMAHPPLPEFKEKKLLGNQATSDFPKSALSENTHFYTGRPLEKSQSVYLYMFRSFDSKLSRWHSQDQSGFADGANNQRYAPTPTSSFDYLGLLKWETAAAKMQGGIQLTVTDTQRNVTWDIWTVKTNDDQFTVDVYKYYSGGGPGTNFNYNCNSYALGNSSSFWIPETSVANIITGDKWTKITGDDKSKAKIAIWDGGVHSAKVTETQGEDVKKVVGKKGGEFAVTPPQDPSVHWTGNGDPVYYE